eukprot:2894253-Pyramimonas_sp.AAC.1
MSLSSRTSSITRPLSTERVHRSMLSGRQVMAVLAASPHVGTFKDHELDALTTGVPKACECSRLSSRRASLLSAQKSGCRRHNDVQHLEQLLEASTAERKLVVTDTIFSMDGDVAPLAELARLKRRHGFLLVVDEAHATLVCGHNGGGAAQQARVARDVDVHIGTLSKAFGSLVSMLNRTSPISSCSSLLLSVISL